MNTDNIKYYQIDKIYQKGKDLICNLQERQALYIIDQSMNVRVLFYYKPNTYFISDSFTIKHITFAIDLKDSKKLIDICEYVSETFEGAHYLTESKLVKDIDRFVNKYMTDSLVILVDRVLNNILDAVSLEYYNELLLLDLKNIYRLVEIDNIIFKDDITPLLNNFKYTKSSDYIIELLSHIYANSPKVYPNKSNLLMKLNAIKNSEFMSKYMLIFTNVASNTLIAYEQITPRTDTSYENLYNIIISILNIDKSTDDLIDDIEYIVNDTALTNQLLN